MDQDEQNRIDHNRHLYREHIENCAVFAKEMLRGAFIINGAAVTAILASHEIERLKYAAFAFAAGALCSIVSGFYAYIYQFKIALSFRWYITVNDRDTKLLLYDEGHRKKALIAGISSLALFVIGLIVSACFLR